MSLYIRVMTSFWSHRKTAKLRGLIGDDAMWLPLRLWSYAAENQPDGCFKQYSAEELAMLLGYSKNATSMLEALHQAGFMDAMSIHGWEEHNAFHQKFSERAKKAAEARWSTPSPRAPLPEKDMDSEREQALLEHAPSIPDTVSEEIKTFEDRLKKGQLLNLWTDFKDSRKKKNKPMTKRAELLLLRELFKFPSKIKIGLEMAIMRCWTGFDWSWVEKESSTNGSNGHRSVTPERTEPKPRLV